MAEEELSAARRLEEERREEGGALSSSTASTEWRPDEEEATISLQRLPAEDEPAPVSSASPRQQQQQQQQQGGGRGRGGGGRGIMSSSAGASPRAPSSARRARAVHRFLEAGDSNPTFADKAPSILDLGSPAAGSPVLRAASGRASPDAGDEGGAGGGVWLPPSVSSPNLGGLRKPLLGAAGSPPYSGTEPTSPENDGFATVDWTRDGELYLHHNRAVHRSFGRGSCPSVMRAWQSGQGWVVCLLVGVITGMFAAAIDSSVHWMSDLKTGYCRRGFWLDYSFCCDADSDIGGFSDPCPKWRTWSDALGTGALNDYAVGYIVYVLLAVSMATTCAWIVRVFAPYATGSGIPEVKTILGGVVIDGYLGLWTLLLKAVGLVLSVGAGLALGKEGPLVHVGSCVANILCRRFSKYKGNESKKLEMISAASAAGVAVAFGAPVGGVLFSLEEVSTYFPNKVMWRAFFCAIVASLTLKAIDPLQTGKLVLFAINYSNSILWFEYVPFVLLGVIGGVVGVVFIRLNVLVARARKHTWLGRWRVLEIFGIALLSALVNWNSDFLRGSDTQVLAALFHECPTYGVGQDPLGICDYETTGHALLNLMMTACVTLTLTTLTFGSGVPAGLFIPSMVTGASLGRVLGTIVRYIQHTHQDSFLFADCTDKSNCITPGIYALVGAASVLGGVTRMTVSLVVIMFELTGALEYILPIMTGIIFSKWVGDAFGRGGIYDEYIKLKEYPFLESAEHIDIHTKAEDVMVKDPVVLTMHGHTVATLFEQLEVADRLRINGFPVVTSAGDLLVVGYITKAELRAGLQDALAKGVPLPDEDGTGGARRRSVSRSRSSRRSAAGSRAPVTEATRCYFAMLDMRFPKNAPFVDLRPWLHPTPIQVVETTPLHRIFNLFKKLGLRYCLVTRFGKVVGILTRNDLILHLDMQEYRHKHGEE